MENLRQSNGGVIPVQGQMCNRCHLYRTDQVDLQYGQSGDNIVDLQ